jgi:TolB-like protein
MKRLAYLFAMGVLSVGSTALAEPPPTAPSVYVLPFTAVTPAGDLDWAGKAVQENLVADLARTPYHPTAADKPAASTADALLAAKAAGAAYAVVGTYQFTALRLRFDGQLLDVATGAPVTGLTATGEARDLFAMEDALSEQLIHRLHQTAPVAAPPQAKVPDALRPAALAAAIHPPAGGVGAHYQGSALQSYVESNQTPSVEYTQQVIDARDRNTFGSYNNADFSGFGGLGFGGGAFGYPGYGYGFGYGGYGSGGYLLGISYPVGSVGTYGIGGYGYTGFGGGFGGGRFGFAGGRGSIGFGGHGGHR